jgi:hypothetical protein
MFADGPVDDLDFDDEEFIGIMYRRRKTKNLLRAWILVHVRHTVQNNGYEP